jgi:putative DNA primase/helicase
MPADGGASLGFELVSQLIMPASGRRKACYLTGGPNTGKSTLIDNLQGAVVGRTNTTNFALQDLGGKNQRACLYGKAMNVCADLPAEPMKGVSVFKQITGGDRISAEHKYKDPFSFTPHCHLLFSGNGPIMAPGAGDAFWDRWLVFPFENDFSKGTGNHVPKHELDARLRNPEQLSALLNDVLPILREGRGITETPSMKAALERMRSAGEEDKEEGEPNIKLPSYGGDGATGSDAEPDLG